LSNIISQNSWCSYCSRRKLCEIEECIHCHNNSFASHPKKVYWSKKNPKTVRQTLKYSHSVVIFDCPDCLTEFNIRVDMVSRKNGCRWCPYCRNKTERKLLNFLLEHFPNFEWCRSVKMLVCILILLLNI